MTSIQISQTNPTSNSLRRLGMADSLNPSTAASRPKRARAYTKADEETFRDRSRSRRRSIEQNHEAGKDGDSAAEAAEGGDGGIDLEEGAGKIDRGDRKNGDDKAGEGDGADKLDVEDGDGNVDTEFGADVKAEDGGPSIVAEDGVDNAGLDDITRKMEELMIKRNKYRTRKREEGTWKENEVRMRKQG